MNMSVALRKDQAVDQLLVMSWKEYQKTLRGSAYFPSEYSLQWFIRKHRQYLIEHGALLILRGRDHLHIQRFEISIIDIGAAEACKQLK